MNTNDYITISDSNDNFRSWSEKPYITKELGKSVLESDLVIVPQEGFKEWRYPVFPVKTMELFNYLKQEINDQNIEICIEDNDFKELALHYDVITIGYFVITSVLVPIFINVLSHYIIKKIDRENSGVKFDLTVVKGESSKTIHYEGPVEKLNDVIETSEKLWN